MIITLFGVALGINLPDFKELSEQPKPILLGLLAQFVVLVGIVFCFNIVFDI
ncbi:hypothetical protein [Psychroserpens sp. NJDZ02]|uniref:hypothetical protein n=1 Tax=Psychroserpens sp. NJDZ02 TaxID=2570561 RepID=UPI0014562C45|nr:hypothetical protein [Psychroserpens sp. NJDZ02]